MSKRRLEIFVQWVPHSKQGDRVRIAMRRDGTRYIQHYRDSEVEKNAKALMALLGGQSPTPMFRGPLMALIDICFPWNASDSKRLRKQGATWKPTKPDWDNLGKQIGDVLERLGFFKNDGQLASVLVQKRKGDLVGTKIVLRELE